MRVLVCAEAVGSLDAAAVAEAVTDGWERVSRDCVVARPMSDGGRGLLAAVAAGQPTTNHAVEVAGPDGAPVSAGYLVVEHATAWVEAAQAAGLHLLPPGPRDPARATSRGVGQLIGAAVSGGASHVVVGVGDVGACDGGAGMLEALGARAVPATGLNRGGVGLIEVDTLDVSPALDRSSGVTLEFTTDSDVPLTGPRGVARGTASDLGVESQRVQVLEQAMTAWADLLGRAPTGRRVGIALGSGAGGGLGAALYRLGARRLPGIATVLAAAGIDEQCAEADLVLYAMESLDADSLRGSVLSAVAQRALGRARPVVVLARRMDLTRRQWITAGVTAAYPLPDYDDGEGSTSVEESGPGAPSADREASALALGAIRVARTWAR